MSDLTPSYKLRRMEESDLRTVLKWRNHKRNRDVSLDSRIIPLDEHLNWYRHSSDSLKLIFTEDNRPVGVIIYDRNSYYWSIYLDNSVSTGLGLGQIMAALTFKYLKTLGFTKVKAVYGSKKSQEFHKKIGFINGERSL